MRRPLKAVNINAGLSREFQKTILRAGNTQYSMHQGSIITVLFICFKGGFQIDKRFLRILQLPNKPFIVIARVLHNESFIHGFYSSQQV